MSPQDAVAILSRRFAEEVFDTATPVGADWHRSLLRSMRLATETRPPVITCEAADGLEDLLAFRHFLRHAYAAELEWDRLRDLAAALPALQRKVADDMAVFRDYVLQYLGEAGEG